MEIYQKRNISTDNNILGAVGKHGPSSIQRLCRNVVSPKMHSTAPGSYPNIPRSRIICPHEQLTIGIDRAVPKSAQPGCFPSLSPMMEQTFFTSKVQFWKEVYTFSGERPVSSGTMEISPHSDFTFGANSKRHLLYTVLNSLRGSAPL